MPTYHPQPDDKGKPVLLKHPSKPTSLSAWADSGSAATVIPDGELPNALNGIAFQAWTDAPSIDEEWNAVAGQLAFSEPPFNAPKGKASAAGVVIQEADGRIWLVAPSNAYAGYTATFPKGRIDHSVNLQACAIREAFEEAGLKVRITGWLADSNRSLSYTRYYLAERTGGSPAEMGWESQAVHLVPRSALAEFLTHPNDLALLEAIQVLPDGSTRSDAILRQGGGNFERVRIAIGRFREQYGHWPTGLALGGQTHEAIKGHLTAPGYAALASKMTLQSQVKHHLILPHDDHGNQYDYSTGEVAGVHGPVETTEVDRWIWGIVLDAV